MSGSARPVSWSARVVLFFDRFGPLGFIAYVLIDFLEWGWQYVQLGFLFARLRPWWKAAYATALYLCFVAFGLSLIPAFAGFSWADQLAKFVLLSGFVLLGGGIATLLLRSVIRAVLKGLLHKS